MGIKDYLQNKAVGFYVALGVAVLCLAAAIVYPISFSTIEDGMEFVSWPTLILLLLGFILTAACFVIPLFVPWLSEWLLPTVPWILAGCALLGLFLFVPAFYDYIIAKGTGGFELKIGFILPAVFFILTAIAATAGMFIRVIKKEINIEEASA